MNSIKLPKFKMDYPVIGTSANIGIDIWIKFTDDLNILALLKKYKNRSCNIDEYNKVLKFMNDNSLDEYVSKKISKKDKNNIIKFLSSKNEEDLKEYIQLLKKDYENISMYDAYILFTFNELMYKKEKSREIDNLIICKKIKEHNLNKKLVKHYGIF